MFICWFACISCSTCVIIRFVDWNADYTSCLGIGKVLHSSLPVQQNGLRILIWSRRRWSRTCIPSAVSSLGGTTSTTTGGSGWDRFLLPGSSDVLLLRFSAGHPWRPEVDEPTFRCGSWLLRSPPRLGSLPNWCLRALFRSLQTHPKRRPSPGPEARCISLRIPN